MKISKSIVRAIVLAVCPIVTATIKASELPPGWRIPHAVELKRDLFRELANNPYVEAFADFNGDGVGDAAYIVKSVIHSGEALIVRLSDGPAFHWHVLHTIEWDEAHRNMGITMAVEVARLSEYETACGKHELECTAADTELLVLSNPAISYFQFEGATSLFYWSEQSNSFSRAWLSD